MDKYDNTQGVYLQLNFQGIDIWPLSEDFEQVFSVRCVKNN